MQRPPEAIIGLTTSELRRPDRVQQRPQSEPAMRELALGTSYPEAVTLAGAVPVIVPPMSPQAIEPLLDGLWGLVVSGGPDVDPALYGGEPHPALGPTEHVVDVFELELLAAATRRGMPVLCICRGLQLLNVCRGGTLVQDIPTQVRGAVEHRQTEPGGLATHDVRVEAGSAVARLLGAGAGAGDVRVNSFHHQAVDRLGDGLRAVGWAPDGVIEAIEDPSHPFLVGVQWHIESLVDDPHQRGLLVAFIDAAVAHRGPVSARAAA
jgi:putative glutamine amidotransferase